MPTDSNLVIHLDRKLDEINIRAAEVPVETLSDEIVQSSSKRRPSETMETIKRFPVETNEDCVNVWSIRVKVS